MAAGPSSIILLSKSNSHLCIYELKQFPIHNNKFQQLLISIVLITTHSLKYNLLIFFLLVLCTPWKSEKDCELQGNFYDTMHCAIMNEVMAWGPCHSALKSY